MVVSLAMSATSFVRHATTTANTHDRHTRPTHTIAPAFLHASSIYESSFSASHSAHPFEPARIDLHGPIARPLSHATRWPRAPTPTGPPPPPPPSADQPAAPTRSRARRRRRAHSGRGAPQARRRAGSCAGVHASTARRRAPGSPRRVNLGRQCFERCMGMRRGTESGTPTARGQSAAACTYAVSNIQNAICTQSRRFKSTQPPAHRRPAAHRPPPTVSYHHPARGRSYRETGPWRRRSSPRTSRR